MLLMPAMRHKHAVENKINVLSGILDNDVNNDIKLRSEIVLQHISLLEYIIESLDSQRLTLSEETHKSVKSLLLYILPVEASAKGSVPYMLEAIKVDIAERHLPSCFYYVVVECSKIILETKPGFDKYTISNIENKLDEILEDVRS